MSKLPDNITEWAMQVRVLCPDCQSPMHFAHGDFGEEMVPPVKTCWCPVVECSEHGRVWHLNLLNGVAVRAKLVTAAEVSR